MATAVVSAPGKINLTLDILGRREDGYHEMEMLMHAVSLENTVRLTTRDRPGICLSCSNPAVPTGEKNLAYRAAQAFFAAWGHSVGLEIRVEKRVPMEAGMAGGSADAAGVLTGLNRIAGGRLFPARAVSNRPVTGSRRSLLHLGRRGAGSGHRRKNYPTAATEAVLARDRQTAPGNEDRQLLCRL